MKKTLSLYMIMYVLFSHAAGTKGFEGCSIYQKAADNLIESLPEQQYILQGMTAYDLAADLESIVHRRVENITLIENLALQVEPSLGSHATLLLIQIISSKHIDNQRLQERLEEQKRLAQEELQSQHVSHNRWAGMSFFAGIATLAVVLSHSC